MPSMAEEIWREFEGAQGLAWFVRSLLLVGRESKTPQQQIASLDTLQSMVGSMGRYPELIDGLEVVKRSLPGYDEYLAELESMTPPHIRELERRLASPDLTESERKAVKEEAARLLVDITSELSAQAAMEALTQLADPMLPEEAKRVVRESITRMLIDKGERESS